MSADGEASAAGQETALTTATGATQGLGAGGFTPFLAAAATGLGALGWVTAVGGAIVWIYVYQADLPPAQAVAKVPPAVLIANGAEFLAVAFFASLLTAGVLFIYDEIGKLRAGSQTPKLEHLRSGLDQAKDQERGAVAQADKRRGQLEGARAAHEAAKAELEHKRRLEAEGSGDAELVRIDMDRVAQLRQRVSDAEREHSSAQRALTTAREARASAETSYESQASLGKPAGRRILGTGVGLALATFGLAVLVDFNGSAIWNWGHDEFPAVGWIFAAVLSLLVGLIGVFLLLNRGFPTFALFSFIAVPLVFAVATLVRANKVPYVEPVALLRGDGTPFVGFFLAETDKRISVGTFKEATTGEPGAASRVPARLLSLPAADVESLTVGSRLLLRPQQVDAAQNDAEPRTAKEWALETAQLLCEDAAAARTRAEEEQQQKDSGSTAKPLPAVCSDAARADLTNDAVKEREAIDAAVGSASRR